MFKEVRLSQQIYISNKIYSTYENIFGYQIDFYPFFPWFSQIPIFSDIFWHKAFQDLGLPRNMKYLGHCLDCTDRKGSPGFFQIKVDWFFIELSQLLSIPFDHFRWISKGLESSWYIQVRVGHLVVDKLNHWIINRALILWEMIYF